MITCMGRYAVSFGAVIVVTQRVCVEKRCVITQITPGLFEAASVNNLEEIH